ncbi:MAG: hypothetical protein C4327_15055 [Meiothermus sp.]
MEKKKFHYDSVADYLHKQPNDYLYFGPYWWVLKRELKQNGFDFGPNDEPHTVERLIKLHGSLEAARKAGMRYYRGLVGGYVDGNHTMPDNGEEYYLSDPDVYAAARL